MDYIKALNLKAEMVGSMLARKQGNSPIISFAAGTKGAALSITTNLPVQVNGVGIADKPGGGSCIKIFTRDTVRSSTSAIWKHYGVKEKDIVVEKVGRITFKNLRVGHRPPFPGLSVGHYKITAGTIGCFAQDAKGIQYILSNNHILANTNASFFADPVLQPGPLDGGLKKTDEIAKLSHLVPLEFTRPNTMDAAIARVTNDLQLNTAAGGIKKIAGTTPVANKMLVEKYGRTTGHTIGSITTRNLDLQVDFDGKLIDFEDQFEVKGKAVNGIRTKFCSGGDSGAMILERKTGLAAGLLFAGADDGTAFATPIEEILNAFSIKIL